MSIKYPTSLWATEYYKGVIFGIVSVHLPRWSWKRTIFVNCLTNENYGNQLNKQRIHSRAQSKQSGFKYIKISCIIWNKTWPYLHLWNEKLKVIKDELNSNKWKRYVINFEKVFFLFEYTFKKRILNNIKTKHNYK